MDLLSQRYASPFLIMDEFIRLQQLHDFVCEVLKRIADEKAYKNRWEYYLHRVFDISFEEYERRCKMPQQSTEYMTSQEVSNVVNASKELLKGFVPE